MTIDLNNVYPSQVGVTLSPTIFPREHIGELRKLLTQKIVISLDGLAGVGKGTVGKALSSLLQLPHLHSGLIYRALTYIYHDLLLPLSNENTNIVISKIQAGVENGQIRIHYKGKFLEDHELRNEFIDTHLNEYNNNLYVRQKIDVALTNVVLSLQNSPFIIDLRGATPPYLAAAEQNNFKVIRILLSANLQEKVSRRFKEYMKVGHGSNPNFSPTVEESQKIYEECHNAIVRRDTQDIQSILTTNIGLIHGKTGLIDTTNMSIDEVIGTCLQFIFSSL